MQSFKILSSQKSNQKQSIMDNRISILSQPEDRKDIFSKIHEDANDSKHTDLNIIAADLRTGSFSSFGVHSSILRNFNPTFDLFIGPTKDIIVCEIDAVVVKAFIKCIYEGRVNLSMGYSEDMERLRKLFNFRPEDFERYLIPPSNFFSSVSVNPMNVSNASEASNNGASFIKPKRVRKPSRRVVEGGVYFGVYALSPIKFNSAPASTVQEAQPHNGNSIPATTVQETLPQIGNSTAETTVQPIDENSAAVTSVIEYQPQYETPAGDSSFVSPLDDTVEEEDAKKNEFKTPSRNGVSASESKPKDETAKPARKSFRLRSPSTIFSPKSIDAEKSEGVVTPPVVPTVVSLISTPEQSDKLYQTTIQPVEELNMKKKPSRTPRKSLTSVRKAIAKAEETVVIYPNGNDDSGSSKENLKPAPAKPLRKSERNLFSVAKTEVKAEKPSETPQKVKQSELSWKNLCPFDGCNYSSPRRNKDDVEVHMVLHVRSEIEEQVRDIRNNTCPKCPDRKWSYKTRFHLHMIMHHDYLQGVVSDEVFNCLKSYFWSEGSKRKTERAQEDIMNPLKKIKLNKE